MLATTLVVFDPPPPEEVNVSVLDITFAARGYRVSAAADQSVGGVDFILAEAIDQPKPLEPTLPISADVISTDFSLSAQFVEDDDGDGRLSAGDTSPGVSTLVILVPMRGDQFVLQPEDFSNLAQVDLFSAEDGSFSFANIPSGAYQLLFYWTAGFVELPARSTIPHLAVAAVRVDAEGVVTSGIPKKILLKPLPSGATPYPIGAGGAAAVPTGTVDVRAALGDRAPAPLPAASKSDGLDSTMLLAIVGGGLLGLAAISGVALARRRSRR